MTDTLMSKIMDCLTLAGFTVTATTSKLSSPFYRSKYPAIVYCSELRHLKRAYSLTTQTVADEAIEKMEISLFGKEGSCDDFDDFNSRKAVLCEGLFSLDGCCLVSAVFSQPDINGRLSRLNSKGCLAFRTLAYSEEEENA